MIKKKKKLMIIILMWNSWEDTVNSIESALKSSTEHDLSVLLIDNNSDLNMYDKVLSVFSKESLFSTIRNDKNLGFSAGNNVGIKYALEKKCDYIILLNNDAQLDKYTANNMVNYMELNEEVGLCGGCVYEFDQRDTIQVYCGGCVNKITGRSPLNKEKKENQKIDFISGSLMMIRATALHDVGLMSENYFLYWEDVDFSKRFLKNKWSLGCCDSAISYHKGMSSLGTSHPIIEYNIARSSVIFFKTHYKYWYIPVFFILCKKILKYTFKFKFKLLCSVFLGVYDALKNRKNS